MYYRRIHSFVGTDHCVASMGGAAGLWIQESSQCCHPACRTEVFLQAIWNWLHFWSWINSRAFQVSEALNAGPGPLWSHSPCLQYQHLCQGPESVLLCHWYSCICHQLSHSFHSCQAVGIYPLHSKLPCDLG